MLLTPLPAGRDNLLQNLEHIKRKLSNANTVNSDVIDKHKAYLDAIGEGARLLRGQVRPADIDELLHSPRYWALLDMTKTANPPSRVVSDLLTLEISDRLLELNDTIAATREAFNRWTASAGHLVFPDTSFYLRNPHIMEKVDFHAILSTRETITVVFPLAVIEELDRAKRRRDHGRHKASVALAVLERHVKDGLSGKWKDAQDSDRRGSGDIWLDVLLDPRGHVPLPTADDEIIDRAVTIQTLAGRDVTVLTYDTSQAFRARGAGIRDVRKLED